MPIRDEWRLRDVEQKAQRAEQRFWELDALRRDMDSVEHSSRRACAEVDGLRAEVEAYKQRIECLERILEERLSV